MDFSKQLQIWANGDASQGRIMVIAGVILSIAAIMILRGDNPVLKGMLIPMGLVILVNLGYGGFLSYSRPQHITKTQELYAQKSSDTVAKELAKAETDNRNYTVIKPVWATVMVIALILYFVVTKDYYKGLSMGLMGLALFGFLLDTFLHANLKPYLNLLRQLAESSQ